MVSRYYETDMLRDRKATFLPSVCDMRKQNVRDKRKPLWARHSVAERNLSTAIK